MKKRIFLFATLLVISVVLPMLAADANSLDAVRKFANENIHWMGQSGFKITGGEVTVYVDPRMPKAGEQAGILLVTHSHEDHMSRGAIKKLKGADTTFLAPAGCDTTATAVKPGDKLTIKGITIEVVPAYNTNKDSHPKSANWVGYIITINGIRIYQAGDTDRIPEMKGMKVDIAMLPVGGTYTMTAEEAAQAALDIMPKIAIPMHYGSIVGTPEDGDNFKGFLNGKIEVIVKKLE